ncbi:MAG: class I SAM-dependent methyltransferase [Actinobacteria bacterium]|nr:class I SAM-dependent methyltransferase [Actinomycetota bacterium]
MPVEVDQLWEANALWWQQRFTEGADPEYAEQIVPLLKEELGRAAGRFQGLGRVLDIGSGEGQLCRVAAGVPGVAQVVGLDPTWAQLAEASRRQLPRGQTGADVVYLQAGAAALPFPDESFDAAFACLVFEHIEGAEAALGEVGRVLARGGTFLLMLNHPLLQAPGSGWVDDHILGEQYWRIGPYLAEHHGVEEVDKGVWLPFIHRPLSVYVNSLAKAGMYLTGMAEPAPPPGFLDRAEEYQQAAAFPRLLVLRAEKLARCRPGAAQ